MSRAQASSISPITDLVSGKDVIPLPLVVTREQLLLVWISDGKVDIKITPGLDGEIETWD